MNYENLFCILVGGTFGFEFIISFAAYDAIDTILHHKEKNGIIQPLLQLELLPLLPSFLQQPS